MRDLSDLTEGEQQQLETLDKAIENAGKAEDWAHACRTGRNEAINALRIEHGWTIADVAMVSGLSQAAIAKIGEGVVPGRKRSGDSE